MPDKAFFDHVRVPLYGGTLTGGQVSGLSAIVDEARRRNLPTEQIAYVLATAHHETGRRMQGVREGFKDTDAEARAYVSARGYRYAVPVDGEVYYGRGLVQLTWIANYRKMGRIVDLNLVAVPDLALKLSISVQILLEGMIRGTFTGKKLSDYLPGDYVGARKTVNGTDRAEEIAGYAREFEAALRSDPAAVSAQAPPAVPLPPPDHPAPKPKPPTATDGQKAGGAAAGGIIAVGGAAAASGHPWLVLGGTVVAAAIVVTIWILIKMRKTP